MSLTQACRRARQRAARWFLDSGIQEPFGGVARYYRTDVRANERVSTEITGYAISTLVWLHELDPDDRLLEAARRAARFLLQESWDPALGLFPFEYARDGDFAEPLAYFFDNAIVVRGLLALWRRTGESGLLEAALRVGAAMAAAFRQTEGFRATLRLPEKAPVPEEPRWSRQPGCYHLKAALAWRELDEAAGEERFRGDAEHALRHALATHEQFVSDACDPATMDRLHAYSYFLEGLLAWLDRTECRQAFQEGLARARKLFESVAPLFERCDVRAQLLRVRLYGQALGLAPLPPEAADQEAAALLAFQCEEADPRLYGGFRFGRRGDRWLPYVNPYSTAFAVQALEMWRSHREGRLRARWQDLI